jgi:hypothetical protein
LLALHIRLQVAVLALSLGIGEVASLALVADVRVVGALETEVVSTVLAHCQLEGLTVDTGATGTE